MVGTTRILAGYSGWPVIPREQAMVFYLYLKF